MLQLYPRPTATERINLCGISGGKDSSALLLWALFDSGYPKETLRFTFCDTGNEDQWTYDHIWLLDAFSRGHGGPAIEWLKPDLDFWELAFSKKRFPSACARFCTEELKIIPTQQWVFERQIEGYNIRAHSGVRANESVERSELNPYDFNGYLLVPEVRPLLFWTIDQVFAIHRRYGLSLNRLYEAGATRVGCFPCIMSRKAEIRNIALNFPHVIAFIADQERRFLKKYGRFSSFFASDKVPLRFRSVPFVNQQGETEMVCSIDDVARWSMTGERARGSYEDEEPETTEVGCSSGFCE